MTKPEGPAQEPQCTCMHFTDGYVHYDVRCPVPLTDHPLPATPAPSQPMSAVRMDEMGVDDVTIDATMFRFERMDEQTFWLCAYRGDKRTTFTMWTQDGKLFCRKDDDELGTRDDSENPVIPEPFPAPSQPAGAREKNWLVEAVENCPDPVLKQNCKQLLGNDYTNAAVQFIADAQTAAKDAEITEWRHDADSFRVERDQWRLRAETEHSENERLRQNWRIKAQQHKEELVAAERERDSLRELLKRLNRRGGLGLDVHEEIDAALKAGKDGQQ